MAQKPHVASGRWRTSGAKAIRARQLRQEQTPAETLLWERLRNHRLDGFQFRRQHPIDRFIVDFCCLERQLVVEVDGDVHADQAEYDGERTRTLESLGYHVLRYTNDQVEHQIHHVLATLRAYLTH